jgi:GNAT superfamily N-acetyltransferase
MSRGRAGAPPRPAVRVRPARPRDVPVLMSLIRALAEYERLAHAVVARPSDLRAALFGSPPAAEAVLAELDDEAVGFALFFHSFSTFVGKRGLYLEDLFVRPEFRGRGVGTALLRHLAAVAVARGCGRFEWAVLDWNEPALAFYRRLGAEPLGDWTVHRLTGAPLVKLARRGRRSRRAQAGSARRSPSRGARDPFRVPN